jgi:hypothetical protein
MEDIFLNFFSIVDDPNSFVFHHANMVKIFYDEYTTILKKKTEPVYRKDLRNKYSLQALIRYLSPARLFKAWSFILKESRQPDGKVFWYGLTDRYVTVENEVYDVYNYNILKTLGRENVICMQDTRDKQSKKYLPDIYLEDFALPVFFLQVYLTVIWNRKINRFAKNLVQKYPKLGFSSKQVKRIVVKFWAKYFLFRSILKKLKSKSVVNLCHYSKHSFNLACRHLGIPNLELMHGHIMRTHPYYNIPNLPPGFFLPMRELLPDTIGVYGQYWKDNLIEGKQFSCEQVKVAGYYLHNGGIHKSKQDERTTILITTQPYVQKEIIEYVSFLKSHLNASTTKVIIKPHPAEDISNYLAIQDSQLVYVITGDVYTLLQTADIHISVFSTVLFEAIRYDLANYVLFVNRFARECNDIIDSGVAERLNLDEIPALNPVISKNARYYFDDFDIQRFHDMIIEKPLT